MKFKQRSLSLLLITVMISVLGLSPVYAANGKKKIEATYSNIRIIYNNKQVGIPNTQEPFVTAGTTYVPLRLVSTIFDKDIGWDGKNNIITLKDKAGSSSASEPLINSLKSQLTQKQTTISYLQSENNRLKRELQKKDDDDDDDDEDKFDELEKDIQHDYDDYEDISWDIELDGDEDEISVEIEFDGDDDDDEDDWNDLSSSKKEKLVEDICDDIWDEYDDADIDGYIKNTDTKKKVLEFKDNSKHDKIIFEDDEDEDVEDLEDKLDRKYDDKLDNLDLSVKLDENHGDIEFIIVVDKYDKHEDDWEDLSDKTIENLMEDIYEEIEDEFSKADIEGYIYSDDKKTLLAKYTDSKKFKREVD